MRQLNNNVLLSAYADAVKYKLHKDFILMLEEEINRRGLVGMERLENIDLDVIHPTSDRQ